MKRGDPIKVQLPLKENLIKARLPNDERLLYLEFTRTMPAKQQVFCILNYNFEGKKNGGHC